MPVIRLANEQQISFDPEAISIISAAFEKACDALGLSNRRDALTELLAKKVIEAAQAGERDPLRIYQMAMDSCVRQLRAIPGGWSEAETVPNRGMSCAVHAAPPARDSVRQHHSPSFSDGALSVLRPSRRW